MSVENSRFLAQNGSDVRDGRTLHLILLAASCNQGTGGRAEKGTLTNAISVMRAAQAPSRQ